jgi:hypothetical protein
MISSLKMHPLVKNVLFHQIADLIGDLIGFQVEESHGVVIHV